MILDLDKPLSDMNAEPTPFGNTPTNLRKMDEQEGEFIRITVDDVDEANKLSLHCPICASPVYRDEANVEMSPVECVECEAIYHKACWEMADGKCAIIGCDCKKCRPYGAGVNQPVALNLNEMPQSVNGPPNLSNNRYKAQERQMQREMRGGLMRRLFEWLLRQIRILDE